MTPHKNSVDLIIIFATIVVVVPFYHNNVFVTSADTPPAGVHGGGVGGGIAESADTADVAGAAAAGKVSHPPPLPVEGVAREAPPLNLDKITDSPVIASTKSAAAAVGAVSTEAIAADAAVEATTTTTMDTSNDHNNNGTIPSVFGPNPLQNRGMIVRMTYVLVGFSILILVYFVVKAVRLRRMKSRTRKYGVLTENLNSPLGLDEDSEEEVEVFEVHGSNVRGGRATSKGGNTASDRLLP